MYLKIFFCVLCGCRRPRRPSSGVHLRFSGKKGAPIQILGLQADAFSALLPETSATVFERGVDISQNSQVLWVQVGWKRDTVVALPWHILRPFSLVLSWPLNSNGVGLVRTRYLNSGSELILSLSWGRSQIVLVNCPQQKEWRFEWGWIMNCLLMAGKWYFLADIQQTVEVTSLAHAHFIPFSGINKNLQGYYDSSSHEPEMCWL